MNSIEVIVRTAEDRGDEPDKDFVYSRAVSYYDPDIDKELELPGIPARLEEGPTEERALLMPSVLGIRFLSALRSMHAGDRPEIGYFNCHWFGRKLSGLAMKGLEATRPAFRAGMLSEAPDTRLGLGQLGLIGLRTTQEVFHSMIGLGSDQAESLQILSYDEELVIAETDEVLAAYQRHYKAFVEPGEVVMLRPPAEHSGA